MAGLTLAFGPAAAAATDPNFVPSMAPPTVASNYITPYNFAAMAPFLTPKMAQKLDPGGLSNQYSQSPSAVLMRNVSANGFAPASAFSNASGRGVISRAAKNPGAAVAPPPPVIGTVPQPATFGAAGVVPNVSTMAQVNQKTVSARAVVPRTASAARSAIGPTGGPTAPRGGRPVAGTGQIIDQNGVVYGAGAQPDQRQVVPRDQRAQNSTYNARVGGTMQVVQANAPPTGVTADRCLADYTECMDSYCHRPNLQYDRCFCSPKLAQIEAEFQPAIRDLTQRLIVLKNGGGGNMSREELEQYWQETFGQFTGENSLANLNANLDIDWSTLDSRTEGQNAFTIGHEYCVRHTQGCYYMAESLRGIYRSSIARDCATYETFLNRLKTAAESVLAQFGP